MPKSHSTMFVWGKTLCLIEEPNCTVCHPDAKCVFCEAQMEERRISDLMVEKYREANKNLREVIYDLEQQRKNKDAQIGLQQGTIGKLYEDVDVALKERDIAKANLQIESTANHFLIRREEQIREENIKIKRENNELRAANNAQREEIAQLRHKLQYEPSPDFSAKIDALKDEIANLQYLHSNQRGTIVKYMEMLDEIHKISDRLKTT